MTQGNAPPGRPSSSMLRQVSIPPSARPSAEHLRALDAASRLDVRLLKKFAQRPLMSVWKGEDKENQVVLLTVVDACGTEGERARVLRAAHALLPLAGTDGIMNVYRLSDDASAFVSDFLGAGSAADLVVLQWPLTKKLDFVCRVADSLAELHDSDVVHGCLCPDNVLMDDDLHPVLTEVGMVSVRGSLEGDPENFFGYGAYAAPETLTGEPDKSADIFSVGRLLSFVVLDRAPELPSPGGDSASPSSGDMVAIHALSPAIALIIKKCVAAPSARYASMKELATDLRRCKQLLVPESTSVQRSPDPRSPSVAPPTQRTPTVRPPRTARPPPRETDAPVRPARKPKEATTTPDAAPAWVPLVSVVLLAGTLGVVLTHPIRSDVLHVVLEGGVIVAAIGLTTGLRVGTGMRVGLGALALVIAVVSNPVDRLAPFDDSDALVRADAARQYVLAGGKNLHKGQLVLGNLSDLDLRGADLEGADLTAASLSKARLNGAHVNGASFVGTDVSGADLTGVDLEHAVAVETASCDETTLFPSGWYCQPSGRIKRGVRPP